MSTYTDASLIYYPSGVKAGKAYSLKPTDGSGDLTFTRASTATRVNSAGLIESVATGVPRIDYTSGCGKLLLEPQRTNLVFPSATASTQTVITTAQSYTLSFYGTGTVVRSGTSTGTLVGTGANDRVFVTFTATAGSLTLTITGSVSDWQLEAGAYPTSLINTAGTAVTRVQDTATKGSIDSLIGQTEGTIFVDMNIDAWDSSSFYFGVYGGGNEIYFACVGTGFLRFKHFGGGTTLAQIQQSGFALGRHKLAARYKNNDWAFYVDGVLIGVDTSGTFSGLIGFCSLGYSSPAAYPSNAKYNSAMVFPTALSNAELATLTTI